MRRPLKSALGASLAIAVLALSGCGLISGGGGEAPRPPAPSASKPATSSAPATAAPAPSKPAPKAPSTSGFAPSPQPKPYDPLLASGSYGYHENPAFENAGTLTATDHDILEQREIDKLTKEQQTSLLKIFRNSGKVHRAIENAGGEVSDASFDVTGTVPVIASDDVAVNTPWVTAQLYARFRTTDGVKELRCWVYRLKTEKGLDNRPYVAGSTVGFVLSDGIVHNPKQILLK
jgi:hypothetical protein